MNRPEAKRLAGREGPTRDGPRGDVMALRALVVLDEDLARRETVVASALALAEVATAEIARRKPELAATLLALQRCEQAGVAPAEVEDLRRSLRGQQRRAAHLMRLAERSQRAALAASAELREGCVDLARRRGAITGRIPRGAVDTYERAVRLGRRPAAIATRGTVCWGCFHSLPASISSALREGHAFAECPHCERVVFSVEGAAQP